MYLFYTGTGSGVPRLLDHCLIIFLDIFFHISRYVNDFLDFV